MKSIRIIAPGLLMLAIAACNTTKIDAGIARADLQLRDKCAYLISAVGIARVASAFAPSAAPIIEHGSALINAYCSGGPINDVSGVMQKMQVWIEAARPIAAQVQK